MSASEDWLNEVVSGLAHLDWALVRHAVPLIVIGSGTPLPQLPPALRGLMAEFVTDSGLGDVVDPAAAAAALRHYYELAPIDPRILKVLAGIDRSLEGSSSQSLNPSLWATLAGERRPQTPAATKSGPSSLFALLADQKKN